MRPQRFYGFAPQLPVGTQIPQMQYGGQVAHSTQFQPQLYSAPQANFGTYPQLQPQFNSFAGPKPVRGRFPRPPIDKRNSTCKACLGIGHWAGDPACPLSGFPATGPPQLALGGPGVMDSQHRTHCRPSSSNLHPQARDNCWIFSIWIIVFNLYVHKYSIFCLML